MSVQMGIFAVTDAQGIALCHAPSQDRSANGKVRMAAKALWIEACVMAGLAVRVGSDVEMLCEDGVWRMRNGASKEREGYADFGHIIANAEGGAFCGCNAWAIEGHTNVLDDKAAPSFSGVGAVEMERYAEAFRALAIAAMTGTKRARVA